MNDIKVYIDEKDIKAKVRELGREVTTRYKPLVSVGKRLILIGILKGASVFLADLMREIPLKLEIDFMVVSSYGNNVSSGSKVNIIKDITTDISDCYVIIVEDILDTGQTITVLADMLKRRNPFSLETCVLLDKPAGRKTEFTADYTGFTIENKFVVGYGLDYAENYRNLRYFGILN